MIVAYIVAAVFVTALLLSILLTPFWKTGQRIKTHHPDIWRSAGPFDPASLIASPGLIGIFINVLIRMENDKELLGRDPTLGKWCRFSMELLRLLPRTLPSRVGTCIIFIYLINKLTGLLLAPFGH
jgi:hypothetical protein